MASQSIQTEVCVIGAGPSASLLAAACAEEGASVTIVAPQPQAVWKPNYCVWADELPTGFTSVIEKEWSGADVHTHLSKRELRRPYVKIDTLKLQELLTQKLKAQAVSIQKGHVSKLVHRFNSTDVLTNDGTLLRAKRIVDASGGGSPFVERVHSRRPAFQRAYGVLLDAPNHSFDPDRAVLMDFRAASPEWDERPTFAYVLPLSDGKLFVEETSLASRPAALESFLKKRLDERIETMGLAKCRRISFEHCTIPMGLGLPMRRQNVVPFGSAASMVHPATGYMMSHVFRKTPLVAKALVANLKEESASIAALETMSVLWPENDRIAWELYNVALESSVDMNADQTSRFFDGFFSLDTDEWAKFLMGSESPKELRRVMTQLFTTLMPEVRWQLIRSSLSSGAIPLLRSVLRRGLR